MRPASTFGTRRQRGVAISGERVLAEADQCTAAGELGELLRLESAAEAAIESDRVSERRACELLRCSFTLNPIALQHGEAYDSDSEQGITSVSWQPIWLAVDVKYNLPLKILLNRFQSA